MLKLISSPKSIWIGLLTSLAAASLLWFVSIERMLHYFDSEHNLQKLKDPALNQIERPGHVYLSGALTGRSTELLPPLCAVKQRIKSGKNEQTKASGTYHFNAAVALPSGEAIKLIFNEDHFWAPEDTSQIDPTTQAKLREVMKYDNDGWIEASCIQEGESIFIEGCLTEQKTVTSCDGQSMILTAGTNQTRLKALNDRTIGDIWGSGIIALCALWIAHMYFFREEYPRLLCPPVMPPPRKALLWLKHALWILAALLMLPTTLLEKEPVGVLLFSGYGLLHASVLLQLIDRCLRVLDVSAPIRQTPELALSGLTPQQSGVKLSATAKRSAPMISPFTKRACAWWRVTLADDPLILIESQHEFTVSKGSVERRFQTKDAQMTVHRKTLKLRGRDLTPEQTELLGRRFNDLQRITLIEESIKDNEPLFFFGSINAHHPTQAETYRDPATLSSFRAQPEKLAVIAGTEKEVLRAMRVELRYQGVLLGLLIVAQLTLLVSLFMYLR